MKSPAPRAWSPPAAAGSATRSSRPAREHGVPIEENPALAQALSTIELDEEIPEALYVAVAEILGFILRSAQN
jgi:type III secretion system FlhB-like substrate exporter